MRESVAKFLKPLERFFHQESSGGIVLMVATCLAIILRNSPLGESFGHLHHLPFQIQMGASTFQFTLHQFINDALMVIFFFVVGLEIKHELVEGQLADKKKATFPILAALGGMIVPALFYMVFNLNTETQDGWAIPMATDIAFAVGVLALLMKRVPFSAKVFLLALAIVDDLGAVLVIALFYTDTIVAQALGSAVAVFIVMGLFRKMGVSNKFIYFVLAFFAWAFVARSGVHATVAGVILGFMTPLSHTNFQGETIRPLDFWLHLLHPWVSYVIMPAFAFFNAGIFLGDFDAEILIQSKLVWGVFAGLVLGKPIGIFLSTYLGEKMGICSKPQDLKWAHVLGIGFIAGIGFTMSIFIAHLSLSENLQNEAKMAVLFSSLIAIIGGVVCFLCIKKPPKEIS